MTDTIPYRPSNGTEGATFERDFCGRCEYSKEERRPNADMADGCTIQGNAMVYDIGHPLYPKEWVTDPNFQNARCTRFRVEGSGTWEQEQADREKYEAAMAEMRKADQ